MLTSVARWKVVITVRRLMYVRSVGRGSLSHPKIMPPYASPSVPKITVWSVAPAPPAKFVTLAIFHRMMVACPVPMPLLTVLQTTVPSALSAMERSAWLVTMMLSTMKIKEGAATHHLVAIMKDVWNIRLSVPPPVYNASLATSWSKATASSCPAPLRIVYIALGVKPAWSALMDSPSKMESALNTPSPHLAPKTVQLVMAMENAPNVWMGMNPIKEGVSVGSRIAFDAWEMPSAPFVLSQRWGPESTRPDVVQSSSLWCYAKWAIAWCVRPPTCAHNAALVLIFNPMAPAAKFLAPVTPTVCCVIRNKLSATNASKDSSRMNCWGILVRPFPPIMLARCPDVDCVRLQQPVRLAWRLSSWQVPNNVRRYSALTIAWCA